MPNSRGILSTLPRLGKLKCHKNNPSNKTVLEQLQGEHISKEGPLFIAILWRHEKSQDFNWICTRKFLFVSRPIGPNPLLFEPH